MPDLIQHVEESVADVEAGRVVLPEGLMTIGGFCGIKTRQLIHRLCKPPVRSYLEVGVLHGATLCAAIAGNTVRAIGIDSFCQDFGGDPGVTARNLERFSRKMDEGSQVELRIEDCWGVDPAELGEIGCLYYDAGHSRAETARGFSHFAPTLGQQGIVIVDDLSWDPVRNGIEDGLCSIAATQWLAAGWGLGRGIEGDAVNWWNGLWIGVLERS